MLLAAPAPTASELYAARLKAVRRELRDEYLAPHDHPWVIGFSGGKDSTLLLHFVLEAICADALRRLLTKVDEFGSGFYCKDNLLDPRNSLN